MRFIRSLMLLWRVWVDIFFQKLFMIGLPKLSLIGGPVQGLTCIVTGPTSGIGSATALELARRGANVILACRNLKRGEALRDLAISQAKAEGVTNPRVDVMYLDLQSLETVRKFVLDFEQSKRPLHVLINNAGIYDMTGGRKETVDGFEQHMGTNYLGSFLLTMLLLPTLRKHACESLIGAHIVNVSSLLHIVSGLSPTDIMLRRRYNSLLAYANSKCAQVLFTRELRRRLGDTDVHTFAVHPGEVMTEIARNIPSVLYAIHRAISAFILLTTSQGARSTIHCATSEHAADEAKSSFGYFHSNCRPTLPDPCGCDDAMAQMLWGYSVNAVELPETLGLEESS